MNNKILIAVVVIAALLGIGWYVMTQPSGLGSTYEWQFSEVGTDENTGAPRTSVTLLSGGKVYSAGTYEGSCSEIEKSSWELQSGEKTGVICWFAGGSSEIGVFEEGGKTVVKMGELSEGDAETPGFRGNFQTIFEL